MEAGEVAARIETADQLALHDRVVSAVLHVLLARPEQLDRRTGHLLGDQDRLRDVVIRIRAAPAEASAEHRLVDVDLVGRQAGRGKDRRERAFGILRRTPGLALLRRVAHGDVHRLHAGVVLVRVGVDRLDLLRRAGQRRLGIAGLVADESLLGVEAGLQLLGDRRARDLGVLAFVPDDRQRVERGLGGPPAVGDYGDAATANVHDFLHALHALDLGGVEALHLAAEHRAFLDRRVQHPRQLDVDAVDHLAVHLVGRVEALHGLADDLPVLRILQLHFLRHLEARRGLGHLAVADLALRRAVRDDAVRRGAFGRRDVPLSGRRLDEHRASRGAALAHVLVRITDAAAAVGGEITPSTLALHAFARGRVFDPDLGPVAL